MLHLPCSVKDVYLDQEDRVLVLSHDDVVMTSLEVIDLDDVIAALQARKRELKQVFKLRQQRKGESVTP